MKHLITFFKKRYFQPKPKKDQKYIEDIVLQILSKPDHKKLIHKDNCFLIWQEGKVSIAIQPNRIKIANHEYLFDEPFTLSFTDKIRKIISASLDQEVADLKQNLFSNKIDLLRKITIKIKNE